MQIQRILVPTDFSDSSREAEIYAAELAACLHASVILLHAVEIAPVTDPRDMVQVNIENMVETARERLNALAVGITVPCETELVVGLGGDAILNAATKHDVQLIVMATHARRGLSRVLLGSVTEYVLRRAPCPVTCIPPSCHLHVEEPSSETAQASPSHA